MAMNAAFELIETVRANGGRIRAEGDSLVVAPDTAALAILDQLRHHKREIIRILRGSPLCDPAEWRQPFIWWLDSTCKLHPRCFGGVTALHRSFCDWEIARDEVPCDRQTFERMLAELGFLMGEIRGTLLVSGLTFEDDVEDAGLL